MADLFIIFFIIVVGILTFDILIASTYTILVICNRRFHTHQNILIANTTFIACVSAGLYIYIYAVYMQYSDTWTEIKPVCIIFAYCSIEINILLTYSFITITINRYLTIVYRNKVFFKTKTWIFVCIGLNCLVSIIIGIPRLFTSLQYCLHQNEFPKWDSILNFFILIIIPSIFMIVFNLLIYIHVHSSSRRVQPVGTNLHYMIHQHSRDIYLLKHMVFIFIVFVVGGTPTLVTSLPGLSETANIWVFVIVRILPVISATIFGLDLIIYSREVRQFLKQKLYRFF